MAAPDPAQRLVPCHDLAGRERDAVVYADHGRVLLVAPPGETAVFTPLEVELLCAALHDATDDVNRQLPPNPRADT